MANADSSVLDLLAFICLYLDQNGKFLISNLMTDQVVLHKISPNTYRYANISRKRSNIHGGVIYMRGSLCSFTFLVGCCHLLAVASTLGSPDHHTFDWRCISSDSDPRTVRVVIGRGMGTD